jgi:hypothetical protein
MAADEDKIRAVLTREAQLKIDLKVAKARAFLDLVDRGVKPSEASQEVALQTEELERQYERAAVERLVLWYLSSIGKVRGLPELEGAPQ